ncbi:hypothetical protein C2G38_2044919 [Gigaspora rosea]|uniref:Uncharacterized protein n=1 Tax=Gigaspora rosea TaxID=44941 RepID=A0A397UEJ1_9GLOM|nr:hypothetical protein C2G38_2044919 [Gigaspora rosea]
MNRNSSIQSNNSGRIDFERNDIRRLLRSLNLVSSIDLTRYNIRTLDELRLLSKVKSKLLDYTRERPSSKLSRGLDPWSEFKPYARRHFHAFKNYLSEQHPPIDASNNMVYWAIRDLHRSRRDALLKERRKMAERKAREKLENAEADNTRSDGYVGYHPRRICPFCMLFLHTFSIPSYVPFLRALPTCPSYVPFLRSLPACPSFVLFLNSPSSLFFTQ